MTTLTRRLQTRRGLLARLVPVALLVALFTVVSIRTAFAQVEPTLATAQSFAVLGGAAVTNTGPTVITGDVGVSPLTAITGFPPGVVVGGTIHSADAVALQAQADNTAAYGQLASQACNTTYGVPTDIGGQTLVPGVYCFTSSGQLTGALTLNAQGNSNSVWIFKTGSTFTTASASSVLLINGGQPCNVNWKIGSSAVIGTSTTFVGNVLALTSITLNTNASLSGRALAQNGAVTLDSNVVSINTCASATLNPPTIGKAFNPATITAGGVSTLTLTLSNANSTAASMTSALTDTLPSGLVVSGNASTTCGGTLTASAGGSTVSLSGGAIPANGSCTVSVDVTVASAGNYINSVPAGALVTDNGSNASPAVATLTVTPPVAAPPTLSKAFSPATITAGGVSTVTLTLTNPDGATSTPTSPLTDTLPSGLLVSGNGSTTCGGTLSATPGSSTVTLTGGSIPANGSCAVTVDVTAAVAGSYFNSLPAGTLQTSTGSNAAPAVATLVVTPTPTPTPPTLSKAFNPATIMAGGASTLTITLNNANSTAATLTAPFIDAFPGGMTLSGSATTTCGGTIAGSQGGSSVTLTGGTIPANGSCTITAPVTAANAGSYANSVPAGALQTSNGSNAAPASSTMTVNTSINNAPTLSKSFSPATIKTGAVSILTVTLNNPSSTVAMLTAPLIDSFPGGIMVAPGASTNTCGGTVTATPGSSMVTLTGGSIPAHGSCTVMVRVVENVCICMGGTNTIPAGALKTSNGSNASAASATLSAIIIQNAPRVSKYFSPSTVKQGGISALVITLSNPNSTVATLTAPFTDTFPAGLLVSGNGTTTCGGALTATPGSSNVTLTGGRIPANGSCRITVYVTQDNFLGTQTNTLPVGILKTSNGNNTAVSSAQLTFTGTGISAPRLAKYFSPYTIKEGGVSTLVITLSNPNSTAAKLTAPFTDTFPAGLLVSGNGTTTCGGALTAIPGSSKITMTGGSIPGKGSCRITVDVTQNNFQGIQTNILPVGALKTSNGNNTTAASANLDITSTGISAPRLSKYFSPAAILNGTTSTLTIELRNPNSTVGKLTAPLIDTFPAGMFIVGNASTSCGGTLTATKGSSTVTLTGASIPAYGSCRVKVDVTTYNCFGVVTNTLPVGALKTSNGNNTNYTAASLTVQ